MGIDLLLGIFAGGGKSFLAGIGKNPTGVMNIVVGLEAPTILGLAAKLNRFHVIITRVVTIRQSELQFDGPGAKFHGGDGGSDMADATATLIAPHDPFTVGNFKVPIAHKTIITY